MNTSLLQDFLIRDLSSGSLYAEFLRQLGPIDLAIGSFDRFDSARLEKTLMAMRQYLDQGDSTRNTAKRVFTMAVECLDNIRNHYELHAYPGALALLSLTREEHHFCITAGNEINRSSAYNLKSRLEMLGKLNAEELDREFMETLLLPQKHSQNGAGLGLILMARKKGNFVDHHFEEQHGRSFFYIRIKIAA